MSAVASSRINKSGKKFAPKATVRRPPPKQAKSTPRDDDAVDTPAVQQATAVSALDLRPVNDEARQALEEEVIPTGSRVNIQLPEASQEPEEAATAPSAPIPISIPIPVTRPNLQRSSVSTTPHPVEASAAEASTSSDLHDQTSLEPPNTRSSTSEATAKRKAPNNGHVKNGVTTKRRRIAPKKPSTEVPTTQEPLKTASSRRKPIGRKTRSTQQDSYEQQEDQAEDEISDSEIRPTTRRKRPQKRAPNRSVQDVAAEIIEAAIGEADGETSQRRKRKATPEAAENHEIQPSEITMSEMCKDTKLGKKSQFETLLQNTDWDEVKKKRKELEEAKQRASPQREAGRPADKSTDPAVQPQGLPKITIVNGQIVHVQGSENVDTTADAADEGDTGPVFNEKDLLMPTTYGTLGRKKNALGKNPWDEVMTSLFYRGLRMFGTDFMMISKMFPGLSRRHVKSKFTREEKHNPHLIRDALLGPREQVNIEEVSEMTQTTYDDPADLEAELVQERKRLEEEYAKGKEDEARANNARDVEDSTVHEDGGTAASDADLADGNSSAKENRFAGIANDIVNAATSSRSKKGRKQGPVPKKNVVRKRKGLIGGSAPTILGSIEES